MGTVYKESFTKPLPPGAEILIRKGQRFARWKDAKGRSRTAPMTKDGQPRISVEAKTYTAKYRDGSGDLRRVTTGCRDEQAARAILADLERRAVRVKAKIVTAAEDAVTDHLETPLAAHVAAYQAHRTAKGLNAVRIKNTEARLKRLAADCGFQRIGDLNAAALERWLTDRAAERMSAGNRNEYRQELIGFANWCVRTGRLLGNPFAGVAKADAKADQRRKRRAMTEAELVKLLDVARRRPLLEAKMVRRGQRQGEAVANVRDDVAERLDRLGRERALIYKTLLLTGLRKKELASLTVGQLYLDGPHPFADLAAADEKNREGSAIPLRADLANDLREWLADKAAASQQATRRTATVRFDSHVGKVNKRQRRDSGESEGRSCLPMTGVPQLPPNTPLFNVPSGLVRILDRDLVLAGIARRTQVDGKWKIDKRDERGRTIDVHALRTSFGTLLSKGGVAPRTAQAAMRHSTIDLTMNTYTDPKLLDVHGALDALPALPLGGTSPDRQRATGTFDASPTQAATNVHESLVPKLVPAMGNSGNSETIAAKTAGKTAEWVGRRNIAASVEMVKGNGPLTSVVNGPWPVERKGVEPSTSALRTQRSPN